MFDCGTTPIFPNKSEYIVETCMTYVIYNSVGGMRVLRVSDLILNAYNTRNGNRYGASTVT